MNLNYYNIAADGTDAKTKPHQKNHLDAVSKDVASIEKASDPLATNDWFKSKIVTGMDFTNKRRGDVISFCIDDAIDSAGAGGARSIAFLTYDRTTWKHTSADMK